MEDARAQAQTAELRHHALNITDWLSVQKRVQPIPKGAAVAVHPAESPHQPREDRRNPEAREVRIDAGIAQEQRLEVVSMSDEFEHEKE